MEDSSVFTSAMLLQYQCLVGFLWDSLPGLGGKQLPLEFLSTGLFTHSTPVRVSASSLPEAQSHG